MASHSSAARHKREKHGRTRDSDSKSVRVSPSDPTLSLSVRTGPPDWGSYDYGEVAENDAGDDAGYSLDYTATALPPLRSEGKGKGKGKNPNEGRHGVLDTNLYSHSVDNLPHDPQTGLPIRTRPPDWGSFDYGEVAKNDPGDDAGYSLDYTATASPPLHSGGNGKGNGKKPKYGRHGVLDADLYSYPLANEGGREYYPEDSEKPGTPEDPELAEALMLSKDLYYETPRHAGTGQSSTSSYEVYENDEVEDGAKTPTQVLESSHSRNITATAGDFAEIDNRFRVEPSFKFEPGEVFKMLWAEPAGDLESLGRHGEGPFSEIAQLTTLGQPFYYGLRRFIIVATDAGHSTCVPIMTYERRACTKRGTKPENHGIIYSPPDKPTLLKGEPELGFRPIRLRTMIEGEKIYRESRVNYAKLVTVEHNVKVLFIGSVYPDDLKIANEAVDECWYRKDRQSRTTKHKKDRRKHDRS